MLRNNNTYPFFGGLFSFADQGNLYINNSYSRASFVSVGDGSYHVGGLIGETFSANGIIQITNSYYNSMKINGTIVGNIFGNVVTQNEKIVYSNVLYNNANGYGAHGQINTDTVNVTGSPLPLVCADLYYTLVNSTSFSNFVWGGDNLLSEYDYIFGKCNCSGGCTTLSPITTPTVTNTAPVMTSNTPTYTTISPTSSASTLIPSTTSPLSCLYLVPNCQNCGNSGIIVGNSSVFNISCVFNSQTAQWGYSFIPRFSNTTTLLSQSTNLVSTTLSIEGNLSLNETLTLNSSTVIIKGDLSQNSHSTIFFVLSDNANKNGYFNVSGCVYLNGNTVLVLDFRPVSGVLNFTIVNYNDCFAFTNKDSNSPQKRALNVTISQFTVKPTYKNNYCDKIQTTLNNEQNTLSVSLSSTLGTNCNGLSTGLIIGIVFAAVGGSLVVIFLGILFFWKRKANQNRMITKVGNEMQIK
eukprot:TRINITY_DN5761_c0_g1_i1.p1 TRINITY_DN5761_c0_g1~~TRINITY_DN5761_c0_g1_i1.p1  ORF type:complete len:467 (+),score=108.75 TRINITY_DN5761_c0_g1_i1:561-1961(+)